MANTLLLESFPVLRTYPLRLASYPLPTTPFFANPNPKSHKPFILTLNSEAKPPNSHMAVKEKTLNPIEFFLDSVSSALRALKKPAIAAVLLGLLLMYGPNSSLAASGGRMGGQDFSSSLGSSSDSGSSSWSSLGSSSQSDLGSSSQSDWGSSWGSSLGSSSGSYSGSALSQSVGSPLSQSVPNSAQSQSRFNQILWIIMGVWAFIVIAQYCCKDGVVTRKSSVIKFQVGLLGTARSLQSDLNRIAETANTSTREGLSCLLQETTLALLRHPDYCISAYSFVDVERGIQDGEKKFNQLSIEERGKFDEETLVNVNNIKRQSTKGMRSTGFSNEYIVITILVAAEGVHKLPAIDGSLALKEAMQKLASIPSGKIMAVEVLWTPQKENDTLSERELLEDYPLLRTL